MEIKKELSEKGFVFIKEWKTEQSINELASSLGTVVKISSYSNHAMVADVQSISPKQRDCSSKNQYSGQFGLNAFPLHTDLAHWSQPPKYLMLRCVKGFEQVSTKVLPLKVVWKLMLQNGLRRAVVKSRGRHSCMLPILFKVDGEDCIRWDSLFLEPTNESSRAIKNLMLSSNVWDLAKDIKLIDYGDTLILNNYLNLHARSIVPFECTERQMERIYFNES
ncbi:hypothetical protein [Idiomarina abyssalis]|uniref:hypothetical protein n=1 Tax=Idiomarina abyssalis TaxID=86102 RepID=UPI003A8DF9C6